MPKRKGNIGYCDTCDYVLECNRCCCTGPSLLQMMYGCPTELLQQAENDREAIKNAEKKELPPKTKMTRAEWDQYARETFDYYRHTLKMEGEDIDITPESEWVEIVNDPTELKQILD